MEMGGTGEDGGEGKGKRLVWQGGRAERHILDVKSC